MDDRTSHTGALAPDPEGLGESSGDGKGPLEVFLLPIYRSRGWVAALLVLGVVGGVFAAALQPNEYTSVGKMLVRVGERERIPPDTVDDPTGSGATQVLANELHLLGNEGIFRRAAQRVGPAEILAPYDPQREYGSSEKPIHVEWLHRLQSWWFERAEGGHECGPAGCEKCLYAAQQTLQSGERTNVSIAPRSNVLVVTHTAHDRNLAKRVVDALIAEFDLRHQEIYTARGAVQLLKARQDEVLREAADADRELIRVQEELGIADIVTERQKLLENQFDLDAEIAMLDLEKKLAERELQRLEERLAAIVPSSDPIESTSIEENVEFREQKEIVDALLMRRAELLRTFKPDARPVRSLDDDIALEREKLDGIRQFIEVPTIQIPANEEHARISQLAEDTRQSIADLSTRRADRESHLSKTEARLRYLRESEPRLADLAMRSRLLRESAEEAASALESKRVLETLDEAKISNLVVLDWGTTPSSKSGPDRKKVVLIGAAAGLALGIALALLRAFLDGRVHGAAELERAAGAPILVSIPRRRGLHWIAGGP